MRLPATLGPVVHVLDGVGTTVSLTGRTLFWLVRRPFRFAQFFGAMEFLGVQSIGIVALTGTFSGMVLALEMVDALRQFQAEGTVGGIVARALTTEISPVFAGIMITARVGSAWAAELGNMRITEQIDALTTMGVSPVQYLLAPRLVASTLMLPLLYVVYTSVGMAGSWVVAVEWLRIDPGVFLDHVHQLTRERDLVTGFTKSAVFGFLVAAISCRHGFFASGGAKGVGVATTRAVVESAVSILVANYILTSWLTET